MAALCSVKKWLYWCIVMVVWSIISVAATEDGTTIISDTMQHGTAEMVDSVQEDTTLPFTYTNPELSRNVSQDTQRESGYGIENIDQANQQGRSNMFSIIATSGSDIKPTSVMSQATVLAKENISVVSSVSPGVNTNQSVPILQPSIESSLQSSIQSTVSSLIDATPTYGIDTASVAVTSAVNIIPLGSSFSTLHPSVLPTAFYEQSLMLRSVDSVDLDNFSSAPALLPSTQLPFTDVPTSSSAVTVSSFPIMNVSAAVLPSITIASMLPSVSVHSASVVSLTATGPPLLATEIVQSAILDSSSQATSPSSNVIQASSSSITASSVQTSLWMVNGSSSVGISSTIIVPSPTTQMKHTSTPETTTEMYIRTWQDSVYQFVFEGNCTLLLASTTLMKSFMGSVKVNLAEKLAIPPERLYMGNIRCGSVIVNITIEHTDMTAIDDQIMEIIASGNFSFSINSTEDKALAYQAVGVKVLLSPSIGIPGPSSLAPEQTEPFEDSLLRGFWELSEMERILIIVFSVLGGFLFILAVAYIVHICCLRGQSKSFDLGDTPDHQVKLEDFTLTKLQRPPTIYDEHGMILTEDLHPGQTKMAVPYVAHGGHTCCHGHVMAFKDSPTLLRRANDSALHGSAENLVTHVTTHHANKDTGIDNMSFSSDDILGDGGDGTDIDTDDDMSPAHHPRHRDKPRAEI